MNVTEPPDTTRARQRLLWPLARLQHPRHQPRHPRLLRLPSGMLEQGQPRRCQTGRLAARAAPAASRWASSSSLRSSRYLLSCRCEKLGCSRAIMWASRGRLVIMQFSWLTEMSCGLLVQWSHCILEKRDGITQLCASSKDSMTML